MSRDDLRPILASWKSPLSGFKKLISFFFFSTREKRHCLVLVGEACRRPWGLRTNQRGWGWASPCTQSGTGRTSARSTTSLSFSPSWRRRQFTYRGVLSVLNLFGTRRTGAHAPGCCWSAPWRDGKRNIPVKKTKKRSPLGGEGAGQIWPGCNKHQCLMLERHLCSQIKGQIRPDTLGTRYIFLSYFLKL